MNDRLQKLSEAGVSVWLDDLSRERLETGNLAELVRERSVVGVTTNPTIFASALADGERYTDQMRDLVAAGAGVDKVIHELTTADVRTACDVLAKVHAGAPQDGRVSIEVEPGLAMDAEGTAVQAKELWTAIDRPNLMVKIPATVPGLTAITAAIAEGISVNVTLIFSLERYRAVMDAYLNGLEQAAAKGIDLSGIHSVASFFVSRVDAEVDKRLDAIGTEAAAALRGKAALANARIAHAAHREVFASERFSALANANVQRPLWASTGVKDPAYPDTLYVSDLVVAGCVNTMPEKTMEAFADHGKVTGDTVTGRADEAAQVLASLAEVGIDFDEVLALLEREGVEKFVVSWDELVATVTEQMAVVGA
ncbi:transaldolase [Nocardioides alcanivorans]|uniref:transaldolase n=1 Tax=Nocardioides alcanivorans TaxID=2897352 RepID=UPI001F2A9E80|nr:transaldolase [Nocardioides alcanivorans]